MLDGLVLFADDTSIPGNQGRRRVLMVLGGGPGIHLPFASAEPRNTIPFAKAAAHYGCPTSTAILLEFTKF